MGISKFLGTVVAAGAAIAFSFATDARAEEDLVNVTAGAGKIVVTSKGGWHINKNFPWKLSIGDQKLDKSKFSFSETSATLTGAPTGKGKLRGGICSGDKCKDFEKDVSL